MSKAATKTLQDNSDDRYAQYHHYNEVYYSANEGRTAFGYRVSTIEQLTKAVQLVGAHAFREVL